MPRLFEFQSHRSDSSSELSIMDPVKDELVLRYQQLQKRLSELKLENEEVSEMDAVIGGRAENSASFEVLVDSWL